jgi:hypothetical protein
MHYDMRPDRLGWTLFDVTTGRPVVWEDVPLTGVDLDAAHELLILLHRHLSPAVPRPACRLGSGLPSRDRPDVESGRRGTGRF